MVYYMEFKVDGGCRGNGQPGSIAAAAAVLERRWAGHWYKKQELPYYPTPTNQRAEITAIIMALEWALEKYEELDGYPKLKVEIRSDSRYAVNCMEDWVYKWSSNGWINSSGYEVANRDLIQKASNLDDEVKELGSVKYIWIPREDNQVADGYVNNCLDEM